MKTLLIAMAAVFVGVAHAQEQITYLGDLETRGTVESVAKGLIVIKDEQGKVYQAKIQSKDEQGVALNGGSFVRFPATVEVKGQYPLSSLQAGQQIRFSAKLNRLGSAEGPVAEIALAGAADQAPGIHPEQEPASANEFVSCVVVAEFSRVVNDRLLVKIPRSEFTRKTALAFSLDKDAVVKFASDDYRRAGAGAIVKRAVLARMSTDDLLVKELEIEVVGQTTQQSGAAEQLLVKYRNLSDEPGKPREIRSRHFVLMTDVSDRQAQILLDKLETMVTLLSTYFGRQPTDVVQGFVVRELSQWPDGVLTEPQGIAKIQEGAGICFGATLGQSRQAIIYCCDDHGVIQHESTHAYCTLAFGSTGPTWLAEGVAEMGQYWKVDELAVDINPHVLQYLQSTSPKRTLTEIAVPGRVPSGGWQDYAWRWALCHLLANNPNYASRFKPLAMALMSSQPDVSFTSVYGPVAAEISFEYDLFLQTLDNGYRADLCAWQWGRKFAPLQGDRLSKTKITAKYGWQASGLRVRAGESYDVAAEGKWKIAGDGAEYTADGDAEGRGRLLGVIFSNYKLSQPIELGTRAKFVAESDGDLYLRCRDDWNRIADNDGELTVHFRITPQ